jgi:hypothetical protein
MSNNLNQVYIKLEANRQGCPSPQSGKQKRDPQVTRRDPSAPKRAAEDSAFDEKKKLIVETYKSAKLAKDKCTEPPSYELKVQGPGGVEHPTRMGKRDSVGMEEKNRIVKADLNDVSHYVNKLHGRSGGSFEGETTVYNSTEIAVVENEDAANAKIPRPIIGVAFGVGFLVLFAMFFVAWRKKKMQKKAEEGDEKLERGQVESTENNARETGAVASV